MKKSAIALAVAAALAASAAPAQAETTFYGRLATGVTYNNPRNNDRSNWDVANHGSRWGVRGSQDLGNGMSVVYRLETAIAADNFTGNGDGFVRVGLIAQ